jgi:MFS transporter, DHA2 family, multidrug resistance protein
MTMGMLGDRMGRRKLLLIGAAGFAAASVLAAFASSAPMLILARGLLGISAATLAPSTLSLIRNMFPDDRERTFAVGVWAACFSAGVALGPLVGGLLLSTFWWGAVFLINVPFMLLLLILGPVLLPEFRDQRASRIDFVSALMALIAVLLAIYGIKQVADSGETIVPAMIIGAGLAIGALLVRRQFGLSEPLLDPALFRSSAFSMTLLINILSVVIVSWAFFFIAQYFQLVFELDPGTAGLWTAPAGLAMAFASLAVPLVVQHVRPAYIIAGAFLVVAIAMGMLARAGGAGGFGLMVAGFVLMSLACGSIGTLTTDLVMSSAPPEKAGAASALSETSFEFGAAVGIALLGSVMTALYRHAMTVHEAASIARDTLAGAVAVASHLPHGEAQSLLSAARSAYANAFTLTAVLSMGLALCGSALAFRFMRRSPP